MISLMNLITYGLDLEKEKLEFIFYYILLH